MIFVDPRVGETKRETRSERLDRILADLEAQGLPCEPEQMQFGDFAFFGNGPNESVANVGIELKEVSDLVNSIRSGRLAEQAQGLAENYTHRWLIVEGFYRARRNDGLVEVPRGKSWAPLRLGKRPVFWRELEAFLTTLEVQANIHVRRTRTTNETSRFIGVLYRWWTEKKYEDHRSLNVIATSQPALTLRREPEAVTRMRRVIKGLNVGIGWERSLAVVAQFGSIYEAMNADTDAWEGVEGIGKKIAGDVVKAIHERVSTTVPASRVHSRDRAASRGVRNPRQRQNRRVDTGRAAQRSVSARREGHR